MLESTRRRFVAAAGSALVARTAMAQTAPSDQIRLGVVGIRGRGRDHYRNFARIPGVRVAFLCDIDERLYSDAVAEVEKIAGYRPDTFVDIRKMLERKDLDAVSIATPDHWHALHEIWACQAGKDVYVEKPVSHNLREGRKMVEAARKYNRIVQAGLNRRSDNSNKAGVRFVQAGMLGKVYRAKAVVFRPRMTIGKGKESSIPKGVNWDLYLGPAAYKAFTLNRFHYGWHYSWDTATGEMGNNGVHAIDIVRWGLAKDVHPVKVTCSGGHFVDDDSDQQTPNYQNATFEYADGTLVDLEVTTLPTPQFGGLSFGEFFYTAQGYVASGDKGWKATVAEFTPRNTPDTAAGVSNRVNNVSFPQTAYKPGPAIPELGTEEVSHFQNFINCVRSRKREDLACEILQGHMSTSLCHLGNIALRTGRKLVFDPVAETFPGDKEASALLTRKYREPYVVPDRV